MSLVGGWLARALPALRGAVGAMLAAPAASGAATGAGSGAATAGAATP